MQRRHFIKLVPPTLVLAACGKKATEDASVPYQKTQAIARHDYKEPAEFDLGTVGSSTFQPHLSSEFALVDPDGKKHTATLQKVTQLPVYPRPNDVHAKRRPPFALTFEIAQSSADQPPQGNYTVAHPSLKSHQLFLTPGRTEDGKNLLGAILN